MFQRFALEGQPNAAPLGLAAVVSPKETAILIAVTSETPTITIATGRRTITMTTPRAAVPMTMMWKCPCPSKPQGQPRTMILHIFAIIVHLFLFTTCTLFVLFILPFEFECMPHVHVDSHRNAAPSPNEAPSSHAPINHRV